VNVNADASLGAVPAYPATNVTFSGNGTLQAGATTLTLATTRNVTIDSGAVSGRVENGVNVFLGIPYAAPPTGARRWVAPRAPARWEGSREATAFGPACPQTGTLEAETNEDCLTLNVWTPVAIITNSSTTPTITFSYASGSSNRWYMDEVRFENIAAGATAPARITSIHCGSSLTIGGTGPASRPFALVSATNTGTPLNQWTPEQTNADGTGSFTFNVTPGAPAARFFRVITQ